MWTLLKDPKDTPQGSRDSLLRFLPQSPAALLPLQFCFWKSHEIKTVWSRLLPFGPQHLAENHLWPFPIVIRKAVFSSFLFLYPLCILVFIDSTIPVVIKLFNLFSFLLSAEVKRKHFSGTGGGLPSTTVLTRRKSSLATESIP